MKKSRQESMELFNTKEPTETKQLSVKLTGDMADIWNQLMAGSSVMSSQILKEAIKLRYLLKLQKKEGLDFFADIDLQGECEVSVSEFLGIE